jgi:hypothetical protein
MPAAQEVSSNSSKSINSHLKHCFRLQANSAVRSSRMWAKMKTEENKVLNANIMFDDKLT